MTRLEQEGKHTMAVLLPLDWSGPQPLTKKELPMCKPLYLDFMYWKNTIHLRNVDPQVPAGYIFVGNCKPLSNESTSSYGNWDTGYQVYRQFRWQEIPKSRRDAFKAADKSEEKILFAGREIAIRTHSLYDSTFPAFKNADELCALPCLSALHCERWHPGLYEYLKSCPFLTDLSLKNHQQKTLDFRHTHLISLEITLADVEELYLNDGLEELILWGPVSETCRIYAAENGAVLRLSLEKTISRFPTLTQLAELHCRKTEEIDLKELLKSYPSLRELRLWGKPGYIRNFAALKDFKEMRVFTTVDMFGFSADDIPRPEHMNKLAMFWMCSLPEDAARTAKQLYKNRKEQGLSLWIQKARKPEWLAQNLDNPFRSWDGQENISAAIAKKAFARYRKTRGEIFQLSQGPTDDIAESAEKAVRDYTEAFNKMNQRSDFIETVEREEIYDALCSIVELLPNSQNIRNRLLDLFDQIRDF